MAIAGDISQSVLSAYYLEAQEDRQVDTWLGRLSSSLHLIFEFYSRPAPPPTKPEFYFSNYLAILYSDNSGQQQGT